MGAHIKAAQYVPETPQENIEGLSILLPLEGRNGFVFLIAFVKKSNIDTEILYQVLSEQIHRLITSFGKDANPQHRFEQFLGSLNETLTEHVLEGKWKVAVVGIAAEKQIFLSGTGELTALFLHKQASNRYQILNLSRSIQTEQTLPTWEKPLAVVLDGDLHEGDVFCVSNKELQREIPPDEFNALLTTLPPNSSIEKIRQYFSIKENILLMVLKIEEKNKQIKEGHAKPLSDLSIDKMVDHEEETALLLEDKKPKIGRMIIWIFEKLLQRKMASRLLNDLQNTQPNWKTYLQKVVHLLKILLKYSKRFFDKFLKLVNKLSKKETREKLVKDASKLKAKITFVPKTTKLLISGTLIAVIILGFGISWLSKTQASSEQLKEYEQQIANVEDVIERANGAVIYKDENQARSLFLNATTLIQALPSVTEEQKGKINYLLEEFDTSMNELRHMVTIPNPALLGDLANVSDGLFGNSLVASNGQLYVFGSDKRVYSLDRTQKMFKVSGTQITSDISSVTSSASDNGQIYALANDTVIQYNPKTQEQKPLDLSDAKQWVDIMAYSNRLYFLESSDNGEGQIYR